MLEVLANEKEILAARQNLEAEGVAMNTGIGRLRFWFSYMLRFREIPPRVAFNKSWDVWQLYQVISNFSKDKHDSILDMGSFNSEIPIALAKGGYKDITALDLNPLGRSINWYGNDIKFVCTDYYNNQLPDKSFKVITTLSVIEHGYDQYKFLSSTTRLLKSGGLLCITTDFNYEKITVPTDYRIFNLPYMIFNQPEIESLIEHAENFGLKPYGSLNWGQSNYPIEFDGFKFTFLMLILQKI